MYLGIDYGKKRIGLALGAALPKGAGVLDPEKDDIIGELKKICEENEVEKIVIGLPTYPSGDEGSLASEVREFASKIEKDLSLETVLEPEGFTSTEAQQILKEKRISYSRESGRLDELAAILILEQYLEEHGKSF